MKEITIREIRQNPAQMISDLEAGESYALMKYRRKIANVVPEQSSSSIIPPRKTGGAHTVSLPRYGDRDADQVDELLNELRGDR